MCDENFLYTSDQLIWIKYPGDLRECYRLNVNRSDLIIMIKYPGYIHELCYK